MLNKIIVRSAILTVLCLIICSCLSTEFKEYSFKINADGSGLGSIKFVNIVSVEDEGKNVSTADFDELINSYINGNNFEELNPNFNVISTEIFKENDVLNGLVKFTFNDFQKIGFYHYQRSESAPIMFYSGSLSETLQETNGEYLGEDAENGIPMIVWAPGTSEFKFKTIATDDMTNTHSLLENYDLWLQTNK